MTRLELERCLKRLCGLFPKWKPTDAERDVWTGKLLPHAAEDVLKAMDAHYAGKHFNDPDLNAILSPLRREPTRQEVEDNWYEHVVKAINEEKAKIDKDLEGFSRTDMEGFKGAILEHEIDRAWMASMPVTRQFWKDLIWERFVQNRAAIYLAERIEYREVDGRRESFPVRPVRYVGRDEYWYELWNDRVRRGDEAVVAARAAAANLDGVATIGQALAGGGAV